MSLAEYWAFPVPDEARVGLFLRRVCCEPVSHSQFLNTLSLLEHIGSRKIMASQSRADSAPSCDTLKHLAEETRHAYFFKRAAESIGCRKFSYGANDVLAGAHARQYMGRLDACIARAVRGPAAYLYMSLIVELRAIWFYEIYQRVLKDMNQPLNLTSLLAEEKRHLEEMSESLSELGENARLRLPTFTSFEDSQFVKMLAGLERAVGSPEAPECRG
jgi:hypothetical protein